MSTTKLTPPLKYPGGKHYLAKRIIELMPPHLHYVEPYFGGGAVLLQRDPKRDWFIDDAWKLANGEKVPAHLRGCSEVVNDINLRLTNFWQTLQHPALFEQFQRLAYATPFSEGQYELAAAGVHSFDDIVRNAWDFFVQCRQSRSGMMKDFATLTRNRTRGGVNEQVNAYWGCIEGLAAVHARLKNVVILNQPANAVIDQQDDKHVLFYVDPPYMHETRATKDLYAYEMSRDDHFTLLERLGSICGKFILSGYHCPLYDEAARRSGWRCIEVEIDNKLAGGKKKAKEVECLWLNY